MKNAIMAKIELEEMRKKTPEFRVGDTVEVRIKIMEGDKERIQPFTGVVTRYRGDGTGKTFSVRRIVEGEGVERTFPLHSPNVVDVIVTRAGKVRRGRLYYLRGLKGKAARIRAKGVAGASAKATKGASKAKEK